MKKTEVKHLQVIVSRGHFDNKHIVNEFYINGEIFNWSGSIDSLLYNLEKNGHNINLTKETVKN
jgi:hypothetical protein